MNVGIEIPKNSLKAEEESELCRCCHAEGTFKNLNTTYYWMDGEPVVYADLLMETFNIDLLRVKNSVQNLLCSICPRCIQRLEDAVRFKRQVVKCEDKFQDIYINNMHDDPIFEVKVKQELPELPDTTKAGIREADVCDIPDRLSEDDATWEDHCSDAEYTPTMIKIVPLKVSKKSHKNKHRPAKGKPSKRKGDSQKVNIKIQYVPGPGRKVPVVAKTENAEKNNSRRVVLKRDVDFKQTESGYQCLKCPVVQKDSRLIRSHIKTVHLNISKHSCPICSKAFSSQSAFTKHKLEEHNIDDRFKCNACEHAFNTKVQLKKHINTFHMLGEKIKCKECDYETFSIESLNKHKFKHKTVKDFHCKYCKKAFLRKTTMQLHERIHTGDRRKVCAVCGQAFVQKASLNYHMAKYHPEVPF